MPNSDSTHFESLYPETSRENEVQEVIDYVKKGNSVQVIGLPGVGRSNFLRMLSYNRNIRMHHLKENYKWFQFVYMDLSEVKNRSSADLMRFILLSLAYSFQERKMPEEQKAVNEFLKETIELNNELVIFQSLKRAIDYLCVERELTVVLMFDRFDVYFPNLTPEFFTNLKILRNRAKYRFSCMFSLPRPLEDMLEPSMYSEFYEFVIGNALYLPLLDQPSTDFRFDYLERASGRKSDSKTKNEILRLTGGHGKLSRISLESVLSEEKNPANLANFLLSKSALQGALLEIWNSLTPFEQKFLLNLKNEKTESNLYLVRSGLLNNHALQIPLFEQNLSSFPIPTDEKIIYIPESNEIKQGDTLITETLSPSEFKLLRFLLQNGNRVCEKEEIIQSVWTDLQTREGVTDQALDQIIYRLRKKIETDPNNPHHILTIKGRGYKFTE